MSPVTNRGRRQSYDNIAAGSAVDSLERTYTDTVSPVELYGGGRVTSTSTAVGDVGNTNIAAGTAVSDRVIENLTPGVAGVAGENVG